MNQISFYVSEWLLSSFKAFDLKPSLFGYVSELELVRYLLMSLTLFGKLDYMKFITFSFNFNCGCKIKFLFLNKYCFRISIQNLLTLYGIWIYHLNYFLSVEMRLDEYIMMFLFRKYIISNVFYMCTKLNDN